MLIGWIGVALFIGILIRFPLLKEKLVSFFLIVGLISLFLSTPLSSFLWKNTLLATFVQFPFRFLSITLLAEAFIAALLVEGSKKRAWVVLCIFLLLGMSSWQFLLPKSYDYSPESFYTTNSDTTTVQNEYMPVWVKQMPSVYAYQKIILIKGSGEVSSIFVKGTAVHAVVRMQKKSFVTFSFAYFPGWEVKVDGNVTPITPTQPDGLIQFTVPSGMHTLTAQYRQTLLQNVANGISALSLIVLVGILLKRKYEK